MKNKNILKKEKGAIIAMFILLLPFLMAFVGLAIDFGYIYATKTKMQNMVDAAALAGVPKLQNKNTPKVGDYVEKFLEENGFDPIGDGSQAVLSEDNNWNMIYQRVVNNPDGTKTIEQLTTTTNATRLQVNILKKINLLFLPIVSADLASIDLTATATAEGSGGSIVTKKKFQIITLSKLILGLKNNSAGYVFIPSYPAGSKSDPQGQDDRGEFLIMDVYAKQFEFKTKSQLRTSGKIFSEQPDATENQVITTDDVNGEGIMFANNNIKIELGSDQLPFREYDEKYETLQKYMDSLWGNALTEIDNATTKNAIIIEIDKDSDYGDFGIKNFIKSGFVDTEAKTDIIVPVIIKNTSNKAITVTFNVSFYSFTKPIITEGVDFVLSGSKYPSAGEAEGFGKASRDRTTFYGIYCLEGRNNGGGTFTTTKGSCIDKDFSGIIYADKSITINSIYHNRRHQFRDTLVSKGDIEFGSDNGTEVAHRFVSAPVGSKISLVE